MKALAIPVNPVGSNYEIAPKTFLAQSTPFTSFPDIPHESTALITYSTA
jgi:hypothetical protein